MKTLSKKCHSERSEESLPLSQSERLFVAFHAVVIVLVFALSLIGCAAKQTMQIGEVRLAEAIGDPEIKTASGEDVYVGISKNFSDEATARNDAALDARKQIVNSLGAYVDYDMIEVVLTTGAANQILTGNVFSDEKTRVVAEGLLSVKPAGWYIEKNMQQTESGVAYFYKAHCLINYSKASHQQLMTEMTNSLLKAAQPLIVEAENAKQQGRIREALWSARQVERLTMEMNGYQAIPVEVRAKIEQLAGRAQKIAYGVELLVVIYERIEGEQQVSREFEPRLAQALAKRNIVGVKSSINWSGKNPEVLLTDREVQQQLAWEEKADLLLVGIAEVPKINSAKAEHNIYSAAMTAQLKLVVPATGAILWEAALPGNLLRKNIGYANNGEDAARNALSLAQARRYDPVDPFKRLADDVLRVLE